MAHRWTIHRRQGALGRSRPRRSSPSPRSTFPAAGREAMAAVVAPDPPGPSPLTGLPGPAPGRPALVVKIDNAPKARPQIGLNQADVVVEEMVEGGITRFAAVFHSQDADPVGPVRSARSTDIGIASALQRPLFAYSGANRVFEEQVRQAPLVDVGAKAAPDRYHRDRSRRAPYNLFSRTPALWQLTPAEAVAPPALFVYPLPGEPAVRRRHGRGPARLGPLGDARGMVLGSGHRRVVAQPGRPPPRRCRRARAWRPPTCIVQFVDYRDTGLRDSSGAVVPEAQVIGEGDAWILTGGQLVPGRWSKASAEAVTRYTDSTRRRHPARPRPYLDRARPARHRRAQPPDRFRPLKSGRISVTVLGQGEARIVGDLPQVAVRIGEVAGVAAIGRRLRRTGDRATGLLRGGDDRVDLAGRPHVLRQRHPAEPAAPPRGIDARRRRPTCPAPTTRRPTRPPGRRRSLRPPGPTNPAPRRRPWTGRGPRRRG